MPPLLNKYEEITYEKLKVLSDENGARVFPKVRIGSKPYRMGSEADIGISEEDHKGWDEYLPSMTNWICWPC